MASRESSKPEVPINLKRKKTFSRTARGHKNLSLKRKLESEMRAQRIQESYDWCQTSWESLRDIRLGHGPLEPILYFEEEGNDITELRDSPDTSPKRSAMFYCLSLFCITVCFILFSI